MSERASLDIQSREPLDPADWPTEPEREYARAQAALAAHDDVAFDSTAIDTAAKGRVHYLEAGDPDGEPVVLLHGVGTTAAQFLPLLGDVGDEYRWIAPDRPGRGLSANASFAGEDLRDALTEYLLDFLAGLDLERPHVVGNSLGGLQAFLLAIDHDRVDRLALVGAPGGVSTEFPLAMRLLTVRGLGRLLLWLQRRGDPLETARDRTSDLLVADDSAVPAEFYDLMVASNRIPGRARSLRSLLYREGSWTRMHPAFDIRDAIVDIGRPTAFFWGTEDFLWPPATGRPLVDRMPNATLEVLEGHGHMPWMEPGDAVATGLRRFLAE